MKYVHDFYCFRYALPGDSGVYECQISTEPKMSRLVRLSVAGKKEMFFFREK